MFSRALKQSTLVPKAANVYSSASALRARSLATMAENTPRHQHPPVHEQIKSTPPARERATFTIRNGPIFDGISFGARSNVSGEAVFTTSLVGYPESLTDPSYRGQILVFTQPLIGNYGVPSNTRDEHGLLKYFESPNIQAVGVVVADVAERYSHWTAVESLSEWCAREGVPAITGVDTRAIVTYLREQGSSLARITIGEEYDQDQDEAFIDPEQINLVRKVSTKAPFHVSAASPNAHVAVIDCGVKENILRSLVSRGASATVFPFDYPIHRVAHHFDGVFISNGPGDPTHCQDTVYHLRKLMETSQVPIMGICLGHQLVALATGARTIKLKYGNRAHNIPALDLTTGKCHITSQNHGYAVDASTLPKGWKPYFINLNDNSNEGLIHESRPIFSTQFHPEAKGGPLDSSYLFDMYLDNVQKYKESQAASQPYRDSKPSPLLVDLLAKERVGVDLTQGIRNMMASTTQEPEPDRVYAAGAA
ncbi:carbamoyl-phosphate synthase arginine-specific small chain [Cladophialophora psammophila CBS 110553]|uniref:Carbamoyl phosphate synthase arginine-specific small chain n=1 Tax=Cladophialophora psammophila CBS 110553 TaxID=1182543 RepID=W9VD71_9EURO|nr:carbamoyl-phosphate synthase arginine-specific small chain [Cladophialophora psammophila CBS 110553]EXJ53398.1 carbamoyl-phosphate synthase arginine-specific small chain [Cladophialophora psammophila CBS 110553]